MTDQTTDTTTPAHGLSAEQTVDRWRSLHVKVHDTDTMDDGSLEEWDMCNECEEDWPCSTALVLERLSRAEAALRSVKTDYEIMLSGTVAAVGTEWKAPEDPAIRALCEHLGYGAVIARAAYLWQIKDPIGAFVQGPCLGTVKVGLAKVRVALSTITSSAAPADGREDS